VEVIWLMRKLRPDFKTIADFRKDNAEAFRAVVREFTVICRELDLFGGELIAVDGTKVKAQNAPDKNFSRGKLQKSLAQVEQRLSEYLQALDHADAQESGPLPAAQPTAEQLQQKIATLRSKKQTVEERLQQLEASGESQVSLTDPDSRAMGKGTRSLVGYNVQATVDGKHDLIVTTEVTNASNDLGQLAPQVQAAKAELGLSQAAVVADSGYYKSEDIKRCQELGIEPYVRAPKLSPSERAGRYGKADFSYDATRDEYRCPAGAQLKRRRRMDKEGKVIFDYDNPGACAHCALKARCTAAAHRTVSRWEHETVLERMAQQVGADPAKLAARGAIIEHCFGTMKWLLPGGFLVFGIQRVAAEVSLAHFAYNLKRALAVVGLDKLLAALKQRGKKAGGGVPRVRGRKQRALAGLIEWICEIARIRSARWNFAA
jgi:transposase